MSHIPKIPLKHSLSQNGWDTLGSPCPLNVGVQDLVTEPRKTTLRGTRGAREGKTQRLVKVSQRFLSETAVSISQNGWDTLGSPCPLNVGVQDLVTEPR